MWPGEGPSGSAETGGEQYEREAARTAGTSVRAWVRGELTAVGEAEPGPAAVSTSRAVLM
ncbi:hypothetical protein GTW52_27680 [Streptomyces sp. SID8358]|nr:hypothetical protein [Streptomyces sp. SID8358]